jgi:3-hydroxy-3-methylglutaryl CoA synthase
MTTIAPRVGIEKLRVYPCTLSLDMDQLCAARGLDPVHIHQTMLVDERSVNPPWEDPVTMAVNAALPMLTDEDRRSIELLIVASESSVDQEKPLSSWVHGYLGLSPNCRNFEMKHACYAGTGALQLALAWVASGLAGDAKALVITTDQSRPHFGQPWEYVLGSGAAAVVVSSQPRFLEAEPGKNGYYSQDVSDLTRPTSRVEVGHTELSLITYMDALEGAYSHYVEQVACRTGEHVEFETYFSWNVYHVPFGGITFRAHRALLGRDRPASKAEAWQHFARRSLPALRYTRRMGGTYGSSTFIALLGLMAGGADVVPRSGDRVGVFAFGSGCCAEFYSGVVPDGASEVARGAGLHRLLEDRHPLSIRQYEEAERERLAYIDVATYRTSLDGFDDWYERHYRDKHYLVFRGAEGYERQYAWS